MEINTVLSLNQTLHNVGAFLFGAGPFYLLLILYKRKKIKDGFVYQLDKIMEDVFSFSIGLWILMLILQGISGASFGVISLIYEGALPEVAPVAQAALIVKVSGAAAAFIISVYLRMTIIPRTKKIVSSIGSGNEPSPDIMETLLKLRQKRERLIWVLLFLACAILTGAAFLRWNI